MNKGETFSRWLPFATIFLYFSISIKYEYVEE